MAASILSIGTAVPPARVPQTAARDVFASQPGLSRIAQRLIHAAFDASAIDYRNTVLTDLASVSARRGAGRRQRDAVRRHRRHRPRPVDGDTQRRLHQPRARPLRGGGSTGARPRPALLPDEVTHVVTVSCTGMFAPGPDFRLVKDLGLPTDRRAVPHRLHGLRCGAARAARGRPHLRRAARRGRARRGSGAVHAAHPLVGGSAADRRGIRLRRRRRRGHRLGATAHRRAAARARAVRHGPHERGRVGHGLDDRRRGLRHGPHRRGPPHHRA